MTKYYAVKKGRKTGIFTTWAECQEQINGFSGAVYKSFPSEQEAKTYLSMDENPVVNMFNDFFEQPVSKPVQKSADFMDYLETDTCVAYVDGSNTNSRVGSGVVMMFGSATEKEEAVAIRNVAGELNSAMMAMHAAKMLGKRKVTIIYDYAGIEEWATGGWSAKTPLAVRYKNFYDNMKQHLEIEFVKVKGHTGNEGNEMVDKIAKRMAGVL